VYPPHTLTSRRRPRRVLAALCLVLLGNLLVSWPASPSIAAGTTSGWLASTVGPDGSVIDPYGSDPSIDWTVNVALALAAAGDQSDALDRAISYIRTNADAYLTSGTSDPAGHLAWLILLATRVGDDPGDFGDSHLDLLAALQDRYGVEEPGLFGTVDVYTSATTQALAILALLASGSEVSPDAVDWLLQQQCAGPLGQAGAWQGHRAAVGAGALEDCLPTTSAAYERADAATTSLAILALGAVRTRAEGAPGVDDAIDLAVGWLRSMQAASGPAAGGFGQYVGDPSDPNSTAMVILALAATGIDASTWTVPGGDPVSSLGSWVITVGSDAGAMSSPYSAGSADLFATYQGMWGIVQTFPIAAEEPPVTGPGTPEPTIEVMAPAFTG